MSTRIVRWGLWIVILVAVLLGVSVLSLCAGSAAIPLNKIGSLILRGRGTPEYAILFQVRLPRIVLGLAVGGALSVAGVILQNLFRNPLAEPYTLGISGGAALAVCAAIMLGLQRTGGALALPLAGFVGAITAVFFLYILSIKQGVLKTHNLLLTGVMVSFVCSSFIMLLMALSRAEDLHGIIFWTMGSLQQSSWPLILAALATSLACLGIAYLFSFSLNVERVKVVLFILAALLTSCSVAVAGIIGFVGLTIPHFVRMFMGADHRIVLPGSFLCGAGFLILCDTAARTLVAPVELPVGTITGVVGGTLFIYVLSRK